MINVAIIGFCLLAIRPRDEIEYGVSRVVPHRLVSLPVGKSLNLPSRAAIFREDYILVPSHYARTYLAHLLNH